MFNFSQFFFLKKDNAKQETNKTCLVFTLSVFILGEGLLFHMLPEVKRGYRISIAE